MRDCKKQQAGDREALGEFHEAVHMDLFKVPQRCRGVSRADHEENRQNDVDQVLQHLAIPMDIAGCIRSALQSLTDHHAVKSRGDVIGGFGVDRVIVEVDMHVGQHRAFGFQLVNPPQRLFQMRVGGVR